MRAKTALASLVSRRLKGTRSRLSKLTVLIYFALIAVLFVVIVVVARVIFTIKWVQGSNQRNSKKFTFQVLNERTDTRIVQVEQVEQVVLPHVSLSPQAAPPTKSYLIVRYTGSGLNNQMFQLMNAMFLAKHSYRVLCLVPFVKRHSDKSKLGDSFEDFAKYFDINSYVETAPIKTCAGACDGKIDHIFTMVGKHMPTHAQYDALGINKATGFTTNVDELAKHGSVTHLGNEPWTKWNITRWRNELEQTEVAYSRCVGVYVPFPFMDSILSDIAETNSLTSAIVFSERVKYHANRVTEELFGPDSFVAIHWRHEMQGSGESKCRSKAFPRVGKGELCFVRFDCPGKTPMNVGSSHNCAKRLHYISVDNLVERAVRFAKSANVEKTFLASDCPDKGLLSSVVARAKITTIRDSTYGQWLLEHESAMMVSFVEQLICIRASNFMGTSYSTWTALVMLMRGSENRKFLDVSHLEKMK
ncbi:O-fucosyltransferase family protein [Pseudoscourfieldia marina]